MKCPRCGYVSLGERDICSLCGARTGVGGGGPEKSPGTNQDGPPTDHRDDTLPDTGPGAGFVLDGGKEHAPDRDEEFEDPTQPSGPMPAALTDATDVIPRGGAVVPDARFARDFVGGRMPPRNLVIPEPKKEEKPSQPVTPAPVDSSFLLAKDPSPPGKAEVTPAETAPRPTQTPATRPAGTAPGAARPATSDRRPLPRPKVEVGTILSRKVHAAGLFRRAGGGLLDLLVLAGMAAVLASRLAAATATATSAELGVLDRWAAFLASQSPRLAPGLLAFCIFAVVYFTVAHRLFGRTLGKALLGIEVVDRTGARLGWFGSLARSLAYLLALLPATAGITWIVFDRENRGMHDRLAGALVIRRQRNRSRAT